MVFHEDEGEEGGRTETAVAQDEENEEVRGEGKKGRKRKRRKHYVYMCLPQLSCLHVSFLSPSC